MRLMLDWIGFSVDIASLRTFFSQKGVSFCAAWEALTLTVLHRRHSAAFDVLSSVHGSIMEQPPWKLGGSYCGFSYCVRLAPSRAATLMNAYPCCQSELDRALQDTVKSNLSTDAELMKQLMRAGASLKRRDFRSSVDELIQFLGHGECKPTDLALLETRLEAGAAIDEIPSGERTRGWRFPGSPSYATDYLILREWQSTRNDGLLPLVSPYSDRQQTTVTVPGIFEAAQGGQELLRSYLNARLKPHDDQDRSIVLEIALSEASGRGYADVVQSLVQFGVDPNVRLFFQTLEGSRRDLTWRPVFRAANNGEVDALRVLVTAPSIDIALLGKEVGSHLDLCALRNMQDYQRDQILRLLSGFGLPASGRVDVLLRAIEPCCTGHAGPDFGFVCQLLELGLACKDCREDLNDDTPHILVRAVKTGCDVRAMIYLSEQDEEANSVLSAGTIKSLFKATLKRRHGRQEILEFFAEKVEGCRSYIQENGSSLLSSFLDDLDSCPPAQLPEARSRHWEENCEGTVTVKWLLDLGAPLTAHCLASLMNHADDSFMLKLVHDVTDANADDLWNAVNWAIILLRLNVAVALIEKGGSVNNPPRRSFSDTVLQQACRLGAPLWFIRFLVDKGADVKAPPAPSGGVTALQGACQSGAELACISFLINKGADVNAPAGPMHGSTALQFAASRGSMNVVALLLDHGADVNAISGRTANGSRFYGYWRAVDFAARYSRIDMVHFLITAGARSSQPGRTGFEGAIEVAAQESNWATARMLREHSDTFSGDPMEAERVWLRANPDARMCGGRIQGAAWVNFVEQSGAENEREFCDYLGIYKF